MKNSNLPLSERNRALKGLINKFEYFPPVGTTEIVMLWDYVMLQENH